MHDIDTVVIGAGHAGLAVSALLSVAGREHVVLERGRLAERWRTERWDSLHLLTPNWMTRLPGWLYTGPHQDGYMSAGELVGHLERYARSFDAPVETGTTVTAVSEAPSGYQVLTDRGGWRTRHVVVATGPWGEPLIPAGLARRHTDICVTTANRYRNPDGLPPGGVLVVGASSSGVQIADELNRAGRDVVLAVGRHTRMPRRYRGMDIFWWLERTGRLARTVDEVTDPAAARREPSLQLVGRNEPEHVGTNLDLVSLEARGVRLVGRLSSVAGHRATFRGDLLDQMAAAEDRMHRFLDAVDDHIRATGLTREVTAADRPGPAPVIRAPHTLDLRREGIGTVLAASGYRPDHSWLRLPITAPDGTIHQRCGVTGAPGVYVVGQRFQHRRDSGFIDGARHDARMVVAHLTSGSPLARARLTGGCEG
jgi:putative flavoprotein involved in K+ transport